MPTKDYYDRNKQINREQVQIFRSPETEAKESAMDDFMFWLEHDCELEVSKEDLNDLQNLINLYVGYDIDKVKQGELEMLQTWKDATNG